MCPEIDNQLLDLISIDVEGAEWFVIKDIISKPKVISTEMKAKNYLNPYFDQIHLWMKNNGYRVWYEFESDVVFILNDLYQPVNIEIKSNNFISRIKKTFGIK